ncbi:MAG: AMP-binding protein [Oscillospiraceae bacterium]|nr:AMP-binding protein [Oscillospiraceae bacterium]
MNIYEYFHAKNAHQPQKIAMSIGLEGGVRSYTYEQFFTKVDIVADALTALGIEPGDRIAIVAESCPEWNVAYIAVAKLKATAVLLDVSLDGAELKRLTDKARVRCVFTSKKAMDKLTVFLDITALDIENDGQCFDGYGAELLAAKTADGDENISTILFSSGTTKTASGIMHTHDRLIGSSQMIEKSMPVDCNEISLGVLPNSHIYGLVVQVIIPLFLGASVYFLDNLNAEELNAAFMNGRPTFLATVPKMFDLLKMQIMRKIDGDPKTKRLFNMFFPKCLALRKKTGINLGKKLFKAIHEGFGSNIRTMCSAGALLSEETADFLYGVGFDILITYGATETNIPTLGNYGKKITTNTCGRAYPDISLKLGADGEILLKTPYMMTGYFDDEESTRDAFDADGWFKTGDLGSINNRGLIKILGRSKDNIVLATGKKAAPDDIENIYAGIPGVKEFVVCGIPASNGNHDEIHAFVVLEQQESMESALQKIKETSASMPHNMRLTDIHVADEIPKTTLMKPKRYLLRQTVKQKKTAVIKKEMSDSAALPDIAAIVTAAVARVAHVGIPEVLPDTKIFSELDIDSLGSIDLCCEIEDKCGVFGIDVLLHKEMTVAQLTSLSIEPHDNIVNKSSPPPCYPLNKSIGDYNIFRFIQGLVHFLYNIKTENEKVLPKDNGYIICANHVSNFDYIYLTLNFKWERFSKFCCMAKKELFKKKLINRMITKIAGMIPVDRGGFVNDSFSAAYSKLKENWGILIHPEGTRSENGELGAFKRGAALLSIEADVPIVPAYIAGGYEIYPRSKKLPQLFNWKKFKRYKVEVKYGEPIFPKNMNADELTKIVESAVNQLKYKDITN